MPLGGQCRTAVLQLWFCRALQTSELRARLVQLEALAAELRGGAKSGAAPPPGPEPAMPPAWAAERAELQGELHRLRSLVRAKLGHTKISKRVLYMRAGDLCILGDSWH